MPLFTQPRRTKVWFDFVSGFYDLINPYLYSREMRVTLLREIEGEHILDVGVGTGYSSRDFKKAVGIDISEEMLRKGKDYKGSLIRADGLNPPLKNESFDTVISAGSLYYFPDTQAALTIIRRLLKPEGVLLTLTPSWKILSPFVYVFGEEDLKRNLEKAGFRVERIEKMRHIAYFCKGRKVC